MVCKFGLGVEVGKGMMSEGRKILSSSYLVSSALFCEFCSGLDLIGKGKTLSLIIIQLKLISLKKEIGEKKERDWASG